MRASVAIKVAIQRPFAEVYEFLADPMNFAKWAVVPGSIMSPLAGGDWLVELPSGQTGIRFAPRNNFGVLDYEIFPATGGHGPVTPVRLVANGDGCELIMLWLQRDGVSDEKFRSDAEWTQSDLQRLKTLLEGG